MDRAPGLRRRTIARDVLRVFGLIVMAEAALATATLAFVAVTRALRLVG